MEADDLHALVGKAHGFLGGDADTQGLQGILKTHHPQAHRPVAQVRAARFGDRVEVDVDHIVEHAHRLVHCALQPLQIESAPPVPPPVVTKITGIRDPVSAGLVTGGTPGQRLVLEGELLSGPDLIRVAIGGQIAPVSRQSPTAVEFTVPPLPAGQTNLELWWLVANNWQSKGRLPFTVKGTEPLPPPPPGPTLSGIVQEPARNAVTTGSVGKSYVALGSDLPTGGEGPGTWLKLTIAGQPVILTAASSRGIAFSIPNTLTGLPLSGPVVLWRLRPGEAAWQPLATGPVFGITEGAAGPAPGPRVVP